MEYLQDFIKSRFFCDTDIKGTELIYGIPDEWWSRQYEYIWAYSFANGEDVCLDAACGTSHHLKYALAKNCKEVHACDLDSSILNKEYITSLFPEEELKKTIDTLYSKINFLVANLEALPYSDKKFDKVYCISVLEHLPYETMEKAFSEFSRVLKDNGLIIITFDYPTINFENFKRAIESAKLTYLGDVDYEIKDNIIKSKIYPGLSCFRAILKKI